MTISSKRTKPASINQFLKVTKAKKVARSQSWKSYYLLHMNIESIVLWSCGLVDVHYSATCKKVINWTRFLQMIKNFAQNDIVREFRLNFNRPLNDNMSSVIIIWAIEIKLPHCHSQIELTIKLHFLFSLFLLLQVNCKRVGFIDNELFWRSDNGPLNKYKKI
jgi:hypothetical protein